MKTKPLQNRDAAGRVAAAVVLALAALLAGAAGPVDPAMLANLHWRSIGPFRGGRVLAVAGTPDDPRRFYFGAVNGGVWRTNDAGRTWQPVFDAMSVASIGALGVAPSAPATLYVGTGEADMRSDIAQGTGLYRSDDSGDHWRPLGLADTQQIARILIDPNNPNVVLVAALGHPYGPNPARGVFRTEDGGAHWTRTLFRDADTGAIDLAAAPDDPSTVYAALWQTRRPPWSVYPPSSGPGSGLYKSTDGGRTWKQLTGNGLPPNPGRIGLATSAARPNRVYALISVRDGNGAGLYRSEDRGATWTRVSADKRITERGWYFSGITADPADADQVFVCDTILLHSQDAGAHFSPVLGDPTGDDFHTLWIDPSHPDRRMLGVDQGAMVSLNGGTTWSSWYNQPTGQFYHVITDNSFPYRVYGAQQDSGAAAVPSRSGNNFDGISMMQFFESAAGGESDNIAPDPDDPQTVFGGRVDKLDLRSGQLRSVDPTLAFPDAYRGTWTLPLLWGPRDHALYFANQRVFRTGDGGEHWQPISPDLTRPDPGVPPTLDTPTAADVDGPGKRRGVVYALAPSPISPGLIWAGTDDGRVWRTRDDGANWQEITPPGLAAWSKIGIIEASHFNADTAYLAVDRHRLDDQAPYLFRTHDGGAHWQAIVNGLPQEDGPNSTNVVREDPRQASLLYTGTERGFFVSFDDGDHWQKLQNALPITSVRDITVHDDDLVIATHGRGFYVLDDVAQLRSLVAAPAIHTQLFPPSPAVRVHAPDFTGTPLPKEEPAAPNPPEGAMIDYSLATAAQSPIALDIFKGAERLRHFASDDPAPRIDPETLEVAPEWVRPPARLETTPGAHRFVWNLRLKLPQILHGGDPPPQPVWVPPGRYAVKLTVDGKTYTQDLQVRPDPRLRLAPGALDAQFELAREIEQARVQCRTALRDAARAEGLTAISDQLDKLAIAVDGADAAPSADAVQGFRLTRAALDRALAMPAKPTNGAR